jgi:hypothetical protein
MQTFGRCPSPRGGVNGGSGVAAVPKSDVGLEAHVSGKVAGGVPGASSVSS